jgi:hypothetical protein
MKLQRVLIALTIVNTVLLVFLLAQRVTAAQDVAQVLRGHSLEIVDDLGRVRASIGLHAAQKLADGSIYPETVLLRLINEHGRPNIKLSAMTDGSGLLVGGESDPAYINLVARGTTTALTLIDRDGRKKLITP